MRPVLKNIVSLFLILAIFFFLGRQLYYSYNEISNFEFSINWPLAVFSLVFAIAFFLLMGYAWKLCLGVFGSNISKFRGTHYWCKSQLGKYLPGTVWYMIGRMKMLEKHNVPKQDSVASMILEVIFLADASLVLALAFLNNQLGKVMNLYLALILMLLGLIVFYPPLLNFIFAKLKHINVRFKRNYAYMLSLFSFYILVCFIASIGFYLFSRAIYPGLNLIYVIGSFMLAYFLGLVIVFAPGGLGVREGVLSFMLSSVMPLPIAIIIAFAARIWWTLAELSSILISWYLVKFDRIIGCKK